MMENINLPFVKNGLKNGEISNPTNLVSSVLLCFCNSLSTETGGLWDISVRDNPSLLIGNSNKPPRTEPPVGPGEPLAAEALLTSRGQCSVSVESYTSWFVNIVF